MTPIDFPLLISGEYNRLRKPRTRAISLNGLSGSSLGVGDHRRSLRHAPILKCLASPAGRGNRA